MKNLRFMIYDFRLALANERRAGIFSNHKSSIVNQKLVAPKISLVVSE